MAYIQITHVETALKIVIIVFGKKKKVNLAVQNVQIQKI